MQVVKVALPKGQLQNSTASLFAEAGFAIADYREGSRSYRLRCDSAPELFLKVFHEKDIAIQVAVGNYDLGICSLDWVEELLSKYRSDAVVKVLDLGYGKRSLYAVASVHSQFNSLEVLRKYAGSVRIVSEYPNLAEAFALKQRLRRFQIFPVWGAAAVYPPENAELAIVAEGSAQSLKEQGLIPLTTLLESSACLVANRNSLEKKDLSSLLKALSAVRVTEAKPKKPGIGALSVAQYLSAGEHAVSLALPDGHQQRYAVDFLSRVGLHMEGYNKGMAGSRLRIDSGWAMVKVVRPQDMPLQVANGNFDLAITGRDWLRDCLYRFPSCPLTELLDLGFGRVRIVAVVSKDLPVSSTDELRKMRRRSALRVASEYINIADKYANDNHLAPCKLIPTWGASEAFVPEDADVLIENTETGSTISRHNLKIIDTLFESTACLIGNTDSLKKADKRKDIARLVDAMRRGAETGTVS
jgi:ATP phosphoribosyltransferase